MNDLYSMHNISNLLILGFEKKMEKLFWVDAIVVKNGVLANMKLLREHCAAYLTYFECLLEETKTANRFVYGKLC